MDQRYTDHVIDAMGAKTTPRLRKVLGSLIQHVHDFTRENQITVEEWMAGMQFINTIGQMSDDKRDEAILVSDVIGMESYISSSDFTDDSLVDAIEHNIHADHADEQIAEITSSAILGPFWRRDAPLLPNGASIIKKDVGGDTAIVFGTVRSSNGNPIEGAEVDVWHTAPNGLYEQQDPDQPEYNLRGRFLTDKEGRYSFHCLRPTSYPIPYDGPAGKLLQLMDRHPYRPAHIHLIVKADGHRQLTTQIFDRRDKYVSDDSVFAVKDELVVDFVPRKQVNGHVNGTTNGTPDAMYELQYDIALKEKTNKS